MTTSDDAKVIEPSADERPVRFTIGQRVTWSAEGMAMTRQRFPDRVGTIIGMSGDPIRCRVVRWDGLKSPYTLHMDFLNPANPTPPDAGR